MAEDIKDIESLQTKLETINNVFEKELSTSYSTLQLSLRDIQQTKEQRSKFVNSAVSEISSTDSELTTFTDELLKVSDSKQLKKIEDSLEKYILEKKKIGDLDDEQIRTLRQNFETVRDQSKLLIKQKGVERKLQQIDGTPIISAFQMAGEEFSQSFKEGEGNFAKRFLSATASATSDLFKNIGEQSTEILKPKNLLKGALHTAGVAYDLPALNILASEMKGSEKDRTVEDTAVNLVEKTQEELRVGPKTEKETPSEQVVEGFKENPFSDVREASENSNEILESIYQDHGRTLEDIGETLRQQSKDIQGISSASEETRKIGEERLFMEKDIADDTKSVKSFVPPSVSAVGEVVQKPEEEGGSLIEDALGMIGGKGGKGAFGKIGGILGKAGGLLGSVAKFAGPIAAVGTTLYGAYEGVQKANEYFDLKPDEEATLGQQVSSGVGGVIDMISFGLVDGKDVAQAVHGLGETAGGAIDYVGESITSGLDFLGETAGELFQSSSIIGPLVGIPTMLSDTFESIKNYVSDIFPSTDEIGETLSDVGSSVAGFFGFGDEERSKIEPAVQTASGIANEVDTIQNQEANNTMNQIRRRETVANVEQRNELREQMKIQQQQEQTPTQQNQQPIIIQQNTSGGGKMASLSTDDGDLLTQMNLRGLN